MWTPKRLQGSSSKGTTSEATNADVRAEDNTDASVVADTTASAPAEDEVADEGVLKDLNISTFLALHDDESEPQTMQDCKASPE